MLFSFCHLLFREFFSFVCSLFVALFPAISFFSLPIDDFFTAVLSLSINSVSVSGKGDISNAFGGGCVSRDFGGSGDYCVLSVGRGREVVCVSSVN